MGHVYLPCLLWAYRNTPHESTKEKPSFLLFGVDLQSATEAAFLPPARLEPASTEGYREDLMRSLTSARMLAADNIRVAQSKYKKSYDKRARPVSYSIGEWILIRFPQEETGKRRKLSRPWHGPYRITALTQTDVTAVKVDFPQEGAIQERV